jgi:hypothetical protein
VKWGFSREDGAANTGNEEGPTSADLPMVEASRLFAEFQNMDAV